MKVRASVKPRCDKCKVISRHGRVMVMRSEPGGSDEVAAVERAPIF